MPVCLEIRGQLMGVSPISIVWVVRIERRSSDLMAVLLLAGLSSQPRFICFYGMSQSVFRFSPLVFLYVQCSEF